MYFEARSHTAVPVADAAAAVRMVHEGKAQHFECPVWLNGKGQRVALVDDSHVNCLDFGECAVVNLDTRRQLESITFAWIPDEATKVQYVAGCQESEGLGDREVTVPMSEADQDQPAQFECSCCGDWFTSTLRKELPHDQDAGFGHCPSCFPETTLIA